MHDLNGTYVWHYVNNDNKIKDIEAGAPYLVCVEHINGKGPVWKMQLAYWFKKGDTLSVIDHKGAPHKFDIKEDGFYMVDDVKATGLYQLFGVRYWTSILQPEVNPEDVLTIV